MSDLEEQTERACPRCGKHVFPVIYTSSDLPRLGCGHHRVFWSWSCDCYWHERWPSKPCPMCKPKKEAS